MAIRLKLKREPEWIELGNGVALFCSPPTAIVTYTGRAQALALVVALKEGGEAVTKVGGRISGLPDLGDLEKSTALYNSLFTVSVAELAASDWRGVNDQDGAPLAFDEKLLAVLFQDGAISEAFRQNYFRPLNEVESEGNV